MSRQFDPDSWLSDAKAGRLLSEREFRILCEKVKEILMEESNIQPVRAPVTICGDLHGQFHDVLELFKQGGEIPQTRYIFMGDFVDRGYNSIETFQLLMCLKLKYPAHITLLRGNHESRMISSVYGFYDEVIRKYGNANVWKYSTDVFDHLPLGALIEGRILCIHGGLSPDLATIDQIRLIDRRMDIPSEGPFADLMWSDPEDIEAWATSPRGAGWLFGGKITAEFNRINGLDLIARAHQLVSIGYKYWFKEQSLVTVWSAPNYCYRCGNPAAMMKIDSELNRDFQLFRSVADYSKINPIKPSVPYFL